MAHPNQDPQFRAPMHGFPGFGPVRPGMEMSPGPGFGPPRPGMDPMMGRNMGYDARMMPMGQQVMPMGHGGQMMPDGAVMFGGGSTPMMNGPGQPAGMMSQPLMRSGGAISSETIQIQDPFSDASMRPPQYSQSGYSGPGQSQQYNVPPYQGRGQFPSYGENGPEGQNSAAPSGEYMGEPPYRPASAASSADGYGSRYRPTPENQQQYDQQQQQQQHQQPFPNRFVFNKSSV